ncbi:hypothetical protein HY995_01195 [Candidatus Micrarchaeota archaeon]|nr:hypothetical protein [Candidatus Micrarchaeota archaeon]
MQSESGKLPPNHLLLPAVALLSFLALAGFSYAQAAGCAPFLTVNSENSKRVVQGSAAAYAIQVSNAGASTQSVSVDAICPTPLQCEFSGLPTPFNLATGQSQAVTLNVNTPGALGNYSLALQVFGGGGSCLEERALNLTVDPNPVQPSASNEFFSATLSSDDAIVQPGESAFWTLVVQSRLEDRQFVSVMHGKGEGNLLESSTFANPDVFPLLAGEEKTVPIEVGIPPSTPGGVYDFILKIRGVNAQGRAYDVDLPVRLYVFSPTLSLQLLSAPASGECASANGGNATYRDYQIKNYGGIEGPFRVELGNAGAPFVSVDKNVLQIAKGETATLRVTAAPVMNAPAARSYYSIVLRYNDYAALRIDDCAGVSEVRGLEALGLREIVLPRGESTSIPFSVRNSGSVATEYSIDYNPQPIAGVFMEIGPKVFTLGVGQGLQGSITFLQTVSAPLGAPQDIPISIHATNFSKPVTLRVKIVADNRTSFLTIRPTSLVAVEGAPSQTAIAVGNGGDDALQSVVLAVEGIPKAWVQVRPSAQDIAGRKGRDYLVTFSVPKGFVQGSADRQTIPFGLVAASGLESVRKDAELAIIRPVRKLDAKVASVEPVTAPDGRTLSVSVKIAVTNAGNVREEDIDASVPFSAAFVATSSDRPTLEPGSAQFVTVTLAPTVDSPEQDVPIILRSTQGGQTTQTVRVPAMGKNPAGASDNGLFLRVGAIVLLLIAIAALLNRKD